MGFRDLGNLRNIIILCVVLVSFATGSYYLYRMFMGDYYITMAKEIEKGRDWNTAISAYRKAIKYSPSSPEYHLLFGKFYLRFANAANDMSLKEILFQKAWCELEEAKNASPKDARTYLALAQTSEALSSLPSSNFYPACSVRHNDSNRTNMEFYYHTAVSLYPNSTQYRYLLARYYKTAEKPDEALAQLERMITLDPGTNRYLRNNNFWQIPNIEEAIENGLRQALKNRFTRNNASRMLAFRLAEKQEWLKAASVYKEIMPEGVFANRIPYYLTMGKYLLRGGKVKEAEAYFLRGVAVAFDRAGAIKRFIGDYKRDRKFDELFTLFKKIKEQYPELIEIDLYRAQVLFGQQNYQGALSHLDDFLKSKETPEADYWMAMTCEKLEKFYKAETYIKRAIKWEPESALYHHFYAGLLYKSWRFTEALNEADATVRASHNRNPWHLDRRAWILYRMKRYEESIETWKLAVHLKPEHEAFRRNIDMAAKAGKEA